MLEDEVKDHDVDEPAEPESEEPGSGEQPSPSRQFGRHTVSALARIKKLVFSCVIAVELAASVPQIPITATPPTSPSLGVDSTVTPHRLR